MDTETKEMFQMILAEMKEMKQDFKSEIGGVRKDFKLEIGEMGAALEARIEESQRETMMFVENNVGKRIDSLFDGYKLAHEKQWELERRVEQMEKRLSKLENKAG